MSEDVKESKLPNKPKTFFEKHPDIKPPPYMVKRGKELASANKKAAGTPNDKGQFYKKVSKLATKK
jgi:hypothetical protein